MALSYVGAKSMLRVCTLLHGGRSGALALSMMIWAHTFFLRFAAAFAVPMGRLKLSGFARYSSREVP